MKEYWNNELFTMYHNLNKHNYDSNNRYYGNNSYFPSSRMLNDNKDFVYYGGSFSNKNIYNTLVNILHRDTTTANSTIELLLKNLIDTSGVPIKITNRFHYDTASKCVLYKNPTADKHTVTTDPNYEIWLFECLTEYWS